MSTQVDTSGLIAFTVTVMDGTTSQEEVSKPPTAGRAVTQPARWYLRSTADGDTHRGRLSGNGTVMADCGLVFRPLTALRDRGPALPGYPPDPGQVCPQCQRGLDAR